MFGRTNIRPVKNRIKPGLFPDKLSIWPPCGTLCWLVARTMIWVWRYFVLIGGTHNDLSMTVLCVDWWHAQWSEYDGTLCWLVARTMIWVWRYFVLIGGTHNDLSVTVLCVDWWHAQWSEYDGTLCWLVARTMIWVWRYFVLIGGMHNDLSVTVLCVDWWHAQWSEYDGTLCWLVARTMIWVWLGIQLICNLPPLALITANISHHQWVCAVTNSEGFVQNQPVLLQCFSLWENMAATL